MQPTYEQVQDKVTARVVGILGGFQPLLKKQTTPLRGFISLRGLRNSIINMAGLDKMFDFSFNDMALQIDGYKLVPFFLYEELIHHLNTKFDYHTSDFPRAGREFIYSKTGVSIGSPKSVVENLGALLMMPDINMYFHTTLALAVLLFFYSKRTNTVIKFTTHRQLQWWDFADNVLAKCTLEDIRNTLDVFLPYYKDQTIFTVRNNLRNQFVLGCCDSRGLLYDMMWVFAHKYSWQEKFFITDHWTDTSINEETIAAHRSQINSMQDISLPVQLTQEYHKYKIISNVIGPNPFHHFLTVIKEEEELIIDLMELNILLKNNQTEKILVALHSMLDVAHHVKYDLKTPKKIFQSLTYHQKCLFFQVMSGVQQKFKHGFATQSEKMQAFWSYIDARRSTFSALCSSYINTNLQIKCYHTTFTFYVYRKWFQMFEHFLDQAYEINNYKKQIAHIENKPNEVFINIKHGYCDSCYEAYKLLEEHSTATKNKQAPAKHLGSDAIYKVLKQVNDITVMRVRYSDKCDLPVNEILRDGQFGHADNVLVHKKQQIKNLMKDLMNAINKEVFAWSAAIQSILDGPMNY
jgi:hypothetical protein